MNRRKLILGAALGAAAGGSQAAETRTPVILPNPQPPEFTGITRWINGEPVTLASLKGKVAVVHFWTFG